MDKMCKKWKWVFCFVNGLTVSIPKPMVSLVSSRSLQIFYLRYLTICSVRPLSKINTLTNLILGGLLSRGLVFYCKSIDSGILINGGW